MKLDDLGSRYNSSRINKLLIDNFDIKFNLNQLSTDQLKNLRESITKSHKKMSLSMPFNSGHRNSEYLEQLALLEAIELRLNEVVIKKVRKNPVKSNRSLKHEKSKIVAMESALTGRQSSALLKLVGAENLSKAKQAIRLAAEGHSVPSNLMHGFKPLIEILLDIMQGGSGYARRLQMLDKQASSASHVNESIALLEGEMEKAQLVMAVKDMVDRVQGMVEDLSKMKVEDLVALSDKMRDEFGQESSSNFINNAGTTLTNAIDTLTNARTELDNAALGLTGQVAPELPGATPDAENTELPMDPSAADEMPGASPEDDMSNGPGSGSELGREKRESREFKKNKILESNRFLGRLSK